MQVAVDSDQLAAFAVLIRTEHGTASGFFVAPGWVVTCAHVVARIRDGDQVSIVPHRSVSESPLTGIVAARSAPNLTGTREWPWPDQALLHLIDADQETFTAHPVPRLDLEGKSPRPDDVLQVCGYSPRADGQAPVRREVSFAWDGEDEDRYWWFKAGQATPGFSGAMLLCRRRKAIIAVMADTRGADLDLGGVAGPVAALAHPEAWPEPYRETVNAVTAAYRQAVIDDPSPWRRVFRHTDPLLDAALEPWTGAEGHQPSPSSVLRPEAQVVPYRFREHDLQQAQEWCEQGPGFAAALVPADGGAGKTRFAIQLAELMTGRGWLTGRIADDHGTADLSPDAIERVAAAGLPRLIVVDYAEAATNLRDLVTQVAPTATDAAPVRLLALSRTRAGSRHDPLAQILEQGSTRWEHALLDRDDPTGAASDLTERQRKELFSDAYSAFTAHFSEPDQPEPLPSVPLIDLTDQRYRLPLEVLFEALDQVLTRHLGHASAAAAPPVQRVLAHERAYWLKTAAKERALHDLDPQHLARAVAAATIAGATDQAQAVAAITAVDPDLAAPDRHRNQAALLTWVRRSYPGPHLLNPLRPDRLGEALCASLISEPEDDTGDSDQRGLRDPGLLPRLLSLPDDGQVASVLDLLARLSTYDQHVAIIAAVAILQVQTDLIPRAERQAEGSTGQPGHYTLARQLHRLLRPPVTEHLDAITTELTTHNPQARHHRRNLAVSYNRLGDLARAAGDTPTAERYYQDALTIDNVLAAAMPDNVQAQRDLSVSYNRLGDLARATGDTPAAERYYQDTLTIHKALAAAMPDNVQAQRDLSVSYNRLGDLARAAGDTPTAERYYQDALTIAQALAEAMPDNVEAQRDLAISYNRLGDLARATGDTPTAERYYQDTLTIHKALDSVEAQRDLSISYNRLGDLAHATGDTPTAERYYQDALTIRNVLAEAMPDNVEAQRDLSVTYNRLGDLARGTGDTPTAERYYQDALTIVQALAEAMPDSVEAQRDLSVSYNNLGDLARDAGDTPTAERYYQDTLTIAQALAEAMPDNVRAQRDLSVTYINRGDLARAAGDAPAAERYYQDALTIRNVLAEAMPDSVEAQRDLSVSYNRLGDLARDAGDTRKARRHFDSALAIARAAWKRSPRAQASAELLAYTLARLTKLDEVDSAPLRREAIEALQPFANATNLSPLGRKLRQWASDQP
ncbi:tetratricopeptide repeat protein [Glycomyces sp. NPDC047369]